MTRSGSGRDELVFALTHEVGNLVGAIRLNAHLIDEEASAVELARASVEIDDTASRIRSLLVLVRPLLDGAPVAPSAVEAASLLEGLGGALDEYGGRGVRVEVGAPDGLPAVAGRRDVLHHLLLSLACYAVEEARPRGCVAIVAAADPTGGVTFGIEDDGAADEVLGDFGRDGRTGRALLCRVAQVLVEPWGGSVNVERVGDRTRVSLHLAATGPVARGV